MILRTKIKKSQITFHLSCLLELNILFIREILISLPGYLVLSPKGSLFVSNLEQTRNDKIYNFLWLLLKNKIDERIQMNFTQVKFALSLYFGREVGLIKVRVVMEF